MKTWQKILVIAGCAVVAVVIAIVGWTLFMIWPRLVATVEGRDKRLIESVKSEKYEVQVYYWTGTFVTDEGYLYLEYFTHKIETSRVLLLVSEWHDSAGVLFLDPTTIQLTLYDAVPGIPENHYRATDTLVIDLRNPPGVEKLKKTYHLGR